MVVRVFTLAVALLIGAVPVARELCDIVCITASAPQMPAACHAGEHGHVATVGTQPCGHRASASVQPYSVAEKQRRSGSTAALCSKPAIAVSNALAAIERRPVTRSTPDSGPTLVALRI